MEPRDAALAVLVVCLVLVLAAYYLGVVTGSALCDPTPEKGGPGRLPGAASL